MSTIPEHLENIEIEYKKMEKDGHLMALNGEEWSSITDIELAIRKASQIFNRVESEKENKKCGT